MTDTTTEAVERLAQTLRDDADANQRARYQPYTDGRMRDAAAVLRALAQERDAMQRRLDVEAMANDELVKSGEKMKGERDAARAEVKRLREALAETAEQLAVALDRLGVCGEGDGKDRRGDVDDWGATQALLRARAALATEGKQ